MEKKYVEVGILGKEMKKLSKKIKEKIKYINGYYEKKKKIEIRVKKDDEERKLLGSDNLSEEMMRNEERKRLKRMWREIKGKKEIEGVMKKYKRREMEDYKYEEEEDDLREIIENKEIIE